MKKAITLNKKKKIYKSDFEKAILTLNINTKALKNIFKRFSTVIPLWHEFIDISFLPNNLKIDYHELIQNKAKQIDL